MTKEIKFKLNIKSIVLYETLFDKSFFSMENDDILNLLYCVFINSNPEDKIEYDSFLILLGNKKFSEQMMKSYKQEMIVQNMVSENNSKDNEEDDKDVNKIPPRLTDIVMSLIVDYHIDYHYMMYELELYELQALCNACYNKYKSDKEWDRIRTFIDIAPHIDSKKLSPEKLMPFPWDEDNRKKKEEELKEMGKSLAGLFGLKKKEETENG